MEVYFTGVVGYLLAQSWQIAALTVVVAVATIALKNRSANIRYLLWLVVLAKCLVPPLYTVPLGILPPQRHIAQPSIVRLPEMTTAETGSPPLVSETRESPAVDTRPAESPQETPWVKFEILPKAASVAWLTGVGVYLTMNLLRALRANFWLARTRKVLPAGFQADISGFFAAYGFRSLPRIWLVDGISQPFVWGLLRGSIYLPGDFPNVSNSHHRRNVLGHELSHVFRFDAAVNFLQVIAQAIFWFHPFVWWANKKIRQEREKCCDEMAISRLNALPKDYSTAIVETLAIRRKSTRPVPSLAVAGPVKNIEERIKTMLRPGKKFYKRPSLITVTVVLLLAFLTVPTALVLTAQEEIEAPKPEPKLTQPLHEAALAGDIERVRSLISKGADVNEKGPRGKTALHCASEKGHAEVARLLIGKGAYVNAIYRPVGTPLHYAAMTGDKKTIELLLSKGADINAKNRRGRTPLFEAMASSAAGRKEAVELLIAKGAEVPALHLAAYMADIEKVKKCLQDSIDVNAQENAGCTALHVAVNSGKKDIVEFLIRKYANVHAKDSLGVTPLYYAATHNYVDIADFLLSKGADVNARDENGCTLLYYAIWDHSKDAINLLANKGANVNAKDSAGYTPLVYAIWENDKDMVELLINKGADVNVQDNDGYTPYYWAVMDASKEIVELLTAKGATAISTIHLAARAGDLAKVKNLVEAGTDVNVKDKGGETPLFSAVISDNSDVAKFLISEGADVNAKDNIGVTPLNFATRARGKKDMVELLISKGADVNAKDERGITPLHSACMRGQKEAAELLIAKGANLNARITGGSAVGQTALHISAVLGHREIAELLIVKGADINAQKSDGQTPLHIACERGQKDVAELLIAKGADMNAKDSRQQTALSLAKEQGHEEIVGLLRKHGAKE
jgi:cytohesin